MDRIDRITAAIGAVGVPGVAYIGYIKRNSLKTRVDTMEQNLNKRLDELMLAIIKSQ